MSIHDYQGVPKIFEYGEKNKISLQEASRSKTIAVDVPKASKQLFFFEKILVKM